MAILSKGELLGKAIVLATNAHSGQFDRGGNPYILHPLQVMYYLNTTDEELMCIAVLHDVIEDTKTTWVELKEAGFTDRILKGLFALTKLPGQTYDEYKDSVFENEDAMLVKMADLRHNTDIRRLKGVKEKDILRVEKYHRFYIELQNRIK